MFFFPSGGDGLKLSVESHTLLSVEVQVTTEGTLATGEGEHGKRNGNGKVDTNLTTFNVMLEVSSSRTGSGEDGGTVTPLIVVNELDGFFKSVNVNNTKSRSEDFFLVTGHMRLNVVNNGGTNEVTLRVLGILVSSTVQGEGSTFSDGTVE